MNEIINNKIIPEEYNSDFSFDENKSGLNISFERIAFIFFLFFIVAIIFSLKVILLSFFLKIILKLKIHLDMYPINKSIIDVLIYKIKNP